MRPSPKAETFLELAPERDGMLVGEYSDALQSAVEESSVRDWRIPIAGDHDLLEWLTVSARVGHDPVGEEIRVWYHSQRSEEVAYTPGTITDVYRRQRLGRTRLQVKFQPSTRSTTWRFQYDVDHGCKTATIRTEKTFDQPSLKIGRLIWMETR